MPGAEELVDDLSVIHYEALDIDPQVDDPFAEREESAATEATEATPERFP
jgi:hypothetical protein